MATSQPHNPTKERGAATVSGGLVLLGVLALAGTLIWLVSRLIMFGEEAVHPAPFLAVTAGLAFTMAGFFSLQPNEAAAILLFGNYKGTNKRPGLHWVPFWYKRKKLSLRVRNLTSETLKVNDRGGNPIEIAAVVVWRVTNTASALFDVDHYENFVNIQAETALREITSHFAYDHADEGEPTLRADGDTVAALLREKLQDRVAVAGVEVDEAKLSHLAYAPEIAGAMLRRQQAVAVLAARQKIVQGAVEMVEHALQQLSERDVVKLDDERRAAMVSNLLVVLCADRDAQPVVNTGTLYQ
jgi:regulator of protease activity HflC (stomatin/prohibitin superfamily)